MCRVIVGTIDISEKIYSFSSCHSEQNYMKIYVVGNPMVSEDCIPLQLLPKLKKNFFSVQFEEVDPNENFIPEEGSIIIDTVQGIDRVTLFDSLDAFEATHSVSPHDYDLGFHLRLLQKIHKITTVRIIGVPQGGNTEKLFKAVSSHISTLLYEDAPGR
jgi:hypothetical protein